MIVETIEFGVCQRLGDVEGSLENRWQMCNSDRAITSNIIRSHGTVSQGFFTNKHYYEAFNKIIGKGMVILTDDGNPEPYRITRKATIQLTDLAEFAETIGVSAENIIANARANPLAERKPQLLSKKEHPRLGPGSDENVLPRL